MKKWLDQSTADLLLSVLAQRALEERLEAVRRHLSIAAREDNLDLEHIHDLRVATRRAAAALDLFEDLLPKRRRKRMRKSLRKIRRTAGEARDLDVFRTRLAAWAIDAPAEAIELLNAHLAAARKNVQPRLRRAYGKLTKNDFAGSCHALVARVRWHRKDTGLPEPTIREAVSQRCRPLVERFAAAAGLDLAEYEGMHQFRVTGKALRYALEVFSGTLDASFREEVYPQLVDLQDRLGEINDLVSAVERLDEWSKETRNQALQGAFDLVRNRLQELLEQRRLQFFQWWTSERSTALIAAIRRLVDTSGKPGKSEPVDSLGNGQAAETLPPSAKPAPVAPG
jgi:CHAD domain-containing protein